MSAAHTYTQIASELRAEYLAKRHWIEICSSGKGYAARDESWHIQQRARLNAIEQVGKLINFISNHAESFDAWKASAEEGKSI